MRSLWLLTVLVVGAVARPRGYGWGYHNSGGDDTCNEEDAAAAKEQSQTIDALTHKLFALSDQVDSMPSPQKAHNAIEELDHELDQLDGKLCVPYKEFSCLTDAHKCISSLLMCDGHDDCGNGNDEADSHCKISSSAIGSKWHGERIYDHCTQRKPSTMELHITDIHTVPFFKSRPQLEARLLIEHHDKSADSWSNLKLTGYWNAAERAIMLGAPESDGLGITCHFHGTDRQMCVGHVVRERTFEPCAEFIFHRQ